MMQQKIVTDLQAKPTITLELLEDVGALNVTAKHIRTLVDGVEMCLSEMRAWAGKQPGFYPFAEWEQMIHLLSMIDEKADYVEEVADRVTEAELEDFRLRCEQG